MDVIDENMIACFADQVDKLLASCTMDQLEYIEKELIQEKAYRQFTKRRLEELRKTIRQERQSLYTEVIKKRKIEEEETDDDHEESIKMKNKKKATIKRQSSKANCKK